MLSFIADAMIVLRLRASDDALSARLHTTRRSAKAVAAEATTLEDAIML